MSDVSICIYCGYPIIFRYKPPRMYHLPSGWHCWSGRRSGGGGKADPRRIPTTTPIKERRPLVEKAKTKYDAYLDSGDARPLVAYLKRQLRARRGDVVRDFLGYLAEPGMDSEARDNIVRKIVATQEWLDLLEELAEDA